MTTRPYIAVAVVAENFVVISSSFLQSIVESKDAVVDVKAAPFIYQMNKFAIMQRLAAVNGTSSRDKDVNGLWVGRGLDVCRRGNDASENDKRWLNEILWCDKTWNEFHRGLPFPKIPVTHRQSSHYV